jgi:phosphoesterase RecJ-like protein
MILKDKMKVMPQWGASFFTLSAKELSAFDLDNGETEGFVNYPLSIKGIVFSAFLREDAVTGEIRISLRSKGDFSVNEFSAQYFNGGGHKNAAGGSYWGSMREAENILVKGIQEHADELIRVARASLY